MEEERRAVSRLKAPVAARALVPENSLGPPALESGVLAPPLSELREMTQWAPCPGWKGVEWEAEGTSWVLALALPSLTIHQQVLLTACIQAKSSPPWLSSHLCIWRPGVTSLVASLLPFLSFFLSFIRHKAEGIAY